MDIKAKAAELIDKIKDDPALLRQFRENPVKVVESIIGMDLPDDQIMQLAGLQRDILSVCQQYVKPGGSLLYSTCTINELENMGVVKAFLNNHDEYELVYSRQLLPGLDETDGFFISKFHKQR